MQTNALIVFFSVSRVSAVTFFSNEPVTVERNEMVSSNKLPVRQSEWGMFGETKG